MWVEKYRPRQLSEVVGQNHIVGKLKKMVDNGCEIPHMLFYGLPGTGKTTVALAFAKTVGADVLELNASDDRGIDVVRSRILTFAKYSPLFGGGFKILLLDEADGVTPDGQNSLRRIMEKYYRNCRFIIVCNDVDKIIPAIQSRCYKVLFKPLSKEEVVSRLRFIADSELLDVDDDVLMGIAETCGGDMRVAINKLQMGDYPKDDLEKFLRCERKGTALM